MISQSPRSWLLLVLAALLWPHGTAPAQPQPVHIERAEDVLALRNSHCRVEICASTGQLLALRPGPDSLRGEWFEVTEEARDGLETWETWARGEETVFSGGPAAVEGEVRDGEGLATLTWRRAGGLEVRGEVVLGPDDPGPRLRLTVRNDTGGCLVDTIRIILRGIELGDPEDDWFTWPHTLGALFRVRGFGPGETLDMAYPAFLTMQWLSLHDREQGVYVGCLDDHGYNKRLVIGRDAGGESLMGVSFVGCWIAEPGDSWTTPWVQVAAHEGDWREGARHYRAFAQEAFGPPEAPQQVWEMPTAQCWLAHHARDADVGRLFEIQQQAPIHASYLMKSLNTSIPEGWDGFRGSGIDIQDAFDRIRALGGLPALFTFDRAPLMGRPNYADHVARWAGRRRDGSFYQAFRDMMPAPFDRDYVRARVAEAVRWVRDFGIDAIQYDTAAMTGDEHWGGPSYRPGAAYRPNEVPHYFKRLYREILDACRAHNPDFHMRAEHCADFFYPEFATSTAHFFETARLVLRHNPPADARMLPTLLRHTLPHHAALQMPSMSDDDFWTYGYGMGHGFHGGGPSWCFNPGVREAESPPGELVHRYRFYDATWRRYYDFRVGFEEAVIDAQWSDVVAEALIDDRWTTCEFPGPLIAVTHSDGGREVTLGQWYHLSRTRHFGQRFLPEERLEPRPVRLRVPTRLAEPRVALHDLRGRVNAEATVREGEVEVTVPDPTCFALEVFTGPQVALSVPALAHPGEMTTVAVTVDQPAPAAGTVSLHLPAGWPAAEPVAVPAEEQFRAEWRVRIPPGIFGRNYPVKAVLTAGDLRRTTAAHIKVMEPLTILYAFDALTEEGPARRHCVDPGGRARLTVTCVNNSPRPADVRIIVEGEQIAGEAAARLEGIGPHELGDPDSALTRWIEAGGERPANAHVEAFDFDCTGVPARPVTVRVGMDGEEVFERQVFPRTRLMDLDGEWQVNYLRRSRTGVGGAERQDNLDTEAVTPDVWDGNWETLTTPIRLEREERANHAWAIYRRLVEVPAAWAGADVQLRLGHMGAPWGQGGTLNIVYVNGWPAGRIGTGGECSIAEYLVFGGWNLIAVASYRPNSLVGPCLFVRDAPAPGRLAPAPAPPRPEGAFLLMTQRPTGQGLGLVFRRGVPEGDHRRTDVARGGEDRYIYFTVADDFMFNVEGAVEIEVEYLDVGTEQFWVDYDSWDPQAPIQGAFKSAAPCSREDTGEWRTHVFRLLDARLANRQHQGADFRLVAGEGQDVRVRRVQVREE